jgi:hypothetical protein
VLLSGRPFIQIDNLRKKLDSQLLEAAITSQQVGVRVPYQGLTAVSTKGVTIFITSNGVELTGDLANRCCIIRIRKKQGFRFKAFDEGDLLDHVQAKQGYYLGCVFAILGDWIQKTSPTEYDNRHSFRQWAASLNWIIGKYFGSDGDKTQMLDGHSEIQKRVSNPFEATLRSVAIVLRDTDRLEDAFQASELVDIAENEAGAQILGRDEAAKCQTFGRHIGALYRQAQSEKIKVEEFVITRESRKSAMYKEVKHYRFELEW